MTRMPSYKALAAPRVCQAEGCVRPLPAPQPLVPARLYCSERCRDRAYLARHGQAEPVSKTAVTDTTRVPASNREKLKGWTLTLRCGHEVFRPVAGRRPIPPEWVTCEHCKAARCAP